MEILDWAVFQTFNKELKFNVLKRTSINPAFWLVAYKGYISNMLKSEVYRSPLNSVNSNRIMQLN
ncbi:hypothetical protein ASJ81_11275 [Methanosarcina spelaei]|uniref:Uncharacterized protein n=1 Tax=Methanosarcina spelaei TaxID=1036679 RepID=A0A2A2HP27_9EURY|nr:hypothetical protein ASJ81_11275 [Methanosarcina spelaei]